MKIATLICALISSTYLLAQMNSRNYRIHVSETPLNLQSTLKTDYNDVKSDNNEFEGKHYVLLQFAEIPTIETKKGLSEAGIELLHYVPNYAWLAKADTSLTIQDFESFNTIHIISIRSEWKMSPALKSGTIPVYAGDISLAEVNVIFMEQPENTNFRDVLSKYSVDIISFNEKQNQVQIKASVDELKNLAEHPLVQYIEFIEPDTEYEGIKEESERIISPYISDNAGKGYYFNGANVRIAVDEGGIFDTLENPNLRNRIVRTFENGTTVGGHKTSVGIRMAKAGNIDPTQQGTAFGADLYSGGISTAVATSNGIVIVNRSYGWGCPGNGETYNSGSAGYDFDIRTNPTFMITHSAGNAGSSDCYAGSPGWGNITGMPKMAKNIFNVGSSGDNGNLTGFSSRGPAKDGRILPHIVAPGPGGTSHASPNLAGVFAQLNHAYRFHYNNAIPHSGLLKAIIMNSADDMQNPGPDFQTGFGHVNARRAYEVIRAGNFQTASVSQGASNQHSISVPANTKELKVMVYWVDWEAAAGISTRSLVNDLDITLEDPTATSFQPWVLNPTFDPVLLDLPAVRATDTLNNNEQITIDNPIPGTYQLTVNGTMVPQGPQTYFMTYEFVEDEIVVTFPHGGEQFVPNETERIRWDACDSNLVFDISYSPDDGVTWNTIATGVNADSRFYDWTVPQDMTNEARIRVERGGTSGQSDTTFTISAQPENLTLIWSCSDSSLFVWDELPNADSYIVYRIVGDYMTQVATTSSTSIVLNGLSLSDSEYISIAAVQNGITSRRVVAIERAPADLNCNSNDVGAIEILSPGTLNIPDCMTNSGTEIKIQVQNWGVNAVDSIPVAYRINNGVVVTDTILANLQTGDNIDFSFNTGPTFVAGNNLLEVWTAYPGDGIFNNDSVSINIDVYSSTTLGPNLTQNFDNFTNCSTAWDCELVMCGLQEGWYNIPNGSGDDIDWRTHSGATGSVNTGPSSDHTTGSGRYLYLEGSGPCLNSTARLHSPCIDLSSINMAQLSFWYHAYGAAIGELHVDVIADGELFEDVVPPVIGEQGDLWTQQIVDLSPFAGHQVVIVIRGSTGGNSWTSDLAIDDMNIAMGPVANYASSETQVCNNDIVTLNNSSLYGAAYAWSVQPNTFSFVGGTNSNSTNPQLSFSASGFYTVQLVASNAVGQDTLQFTDYIYVWEDQPALSSGTYCAGDSVIVHSNNIGQPVDYYLNGTIVHSGTSPSHYFANAVSGDEIYAVYDINNGCTLTSDTLIVDFITVETGITQNGLQLNAVATGVLYQWLDCGNNFASIAGETAPTFAPAANGEYAVQITDNGCTDTSACFFFSTATLSEGTLENFVYYPNPTSGMVNMVFDSDQSFIKVEILNALGQVVHTIVETATNEIAVDLPEARAVYLLRVSTESGSEMISVVKN